MTINSTPIPFQAVIKVNVKPLFWRPYPQSIRTEFITKVKEYPLGNSKYIQMMLSKDATTQSALETNNEFHYRVQVPEGLKPAQFVDALSQKIGEMGIRGFFDFTKPENITKLKELFTKPVG